MIKQHALMSRVAEEAGGWVKIPAKSLVSIFIHIILKALKDFLKKEI